MFGLLGIGCLGIVAIAVIVAVVVIGIYNGLQRKRVAAQTAWSDIDVQLKRRHDLVPNLVNTVKGYATHEKGVFETVAAARSAAMGAKTIDQQIAAEGQLSSAIGRLFAVAEAYPDLKANQNFLQLQEELTSTENKIGFSRTNYNRSVAQFNESALVFPANIIAGMFGFAQMKLYELDSVEERKVPTVQF
ncbi:MAG: LemA family protein [Phycisphaerae bacterium]|mgnify:CR=1 FL=1|nr:LemA family protein [Phycisphaerae bacterium]